MAREFIKQEWLRERSRALVREWEEMEIAARRPVDVKSIWIGATIQLRLPARYASKPEPEAAE